MHALPSTAKPQSPADANRLTVHLPDGWVLVLEREEDGRVDITVRSSNTEAVVLIGGYGQHPRVVLLDNRSASEHVQPVLQVGSCVFVLPDTAAQLAVSSFLAKRIEP